MSKKVDYGTFLEFFSHRIIEIGIPVIITLIFDACLTRFLEKKYYSATFDRYFRQAFQAGSSSTSSTGVSIKWAIIIAVILIAMIVVVTALILVCYYYGCVKIIMVWMIIAVSLLLSLYLFIAFKDVPKLINTPFDWIGLVLFIINIAVIGDLSIFWRAPTVFTQVYLIFISVLIAIVFLNLPDWTVWVLLGVLIIYDCCVVLCPHGLLNVIIQKSEERGDSIPALIYSTAAWISKVHNSDDENENNDDENEENDGNNGDDGNGNNNGTHNENDGSSNSNNTTNNNNNSNRNTNNSNNSDDDDPEINLVDIENPEDKNEIQKKKEYKNNKKDDESNQPLLAPNEPNENDSDGILSTVQTRTLDDDDENDKNDENGDENSKKILTEEERKEKKRRRFESDDEEGIKLGLGDFVFYGILVTRAARIGWDVTILCILAVILGLSITLILLAIFQRPLPALPFSLFIGIIFYFIGIYTFRPFHVNVTQLKITF